MCSRVIESPSVLLEFYMKFSFVFLLSSSIVNAAAGVKGRIYFYDKSVTGSLRCL
jgi:hypothetical protein